MSCVWALKATLLTIWDADADQISLVSNAVPYHSLQESVDEFFMLAFITT